VGGELLVISQFTLLADCRKGRRPSFVEAGEPERARRLYDHFVAAAGRRVGRVAAGVFQAMMKVTLTNDGPVTILLESERRGETS
jgi:D-tyrosyl-tRNA(Tyr) deacylase